MAKVIKYKFLSSENKRGTEDNPKIEQIILDKCIVCPTQAVYDASYPIAAKEAYGKIRVEGEFDEQSAEPTQLDIIEAQLAYTAMMTDTLIEEE